MIQIIGPCVIESRGLIFQIASKVVPLSQTYGGEWYLKASFDKANRTSHRSFRGIGMDTGLSVLQDVAKLHKIKTTTDIHEISQVEDVVSVVDLIQIPALLCRQTDLLMEAAMSGKKVNIKKGQFMSGRDMEHAINKLMSRMNKEDIYVTERGNTFGYNDIVVDFRNIPIMKEFGVKVILDCSHSVQTPGTGRTTSGGNYKYTEAMALAGRCFGSDGVFIETHPNPIIARSDGASMLPLSLLEDVIKKLHV